MQATEANDWILFSDTPTRGRACGRCQACCSVLPVELSPGTFKPARERCPHQCSRGCGIYERRPEPCAFWSCRWLIDPATANLKRPDQSGVVIDCATDTIFLDGKPYSAMQIWADSANRRALEEPALRAYMQHIATTYGYPTIVRFGSRDGYVIFPPPLAHDTEWVEERTDPISQEETEARLDALGQQRFVPR